MMYVIPDHKLINEMKIITLQNIDLVNIFTKLFLEGIAPEYVLRNQKKCTGLI